MDPKQTHSRRKALGRSAVLVLVLIVCGCPSDTEPDHHRELTADDLAELAAWQQERIEDLVAEDGWLNLVGLFWLEPGENRFGTGESNDLRLPPLPSLEGQEESLGSLFLTDGSVRLAACCGVEFEIDAPPDAEPELGDGTFVVFDRSRPSATFFRTAGLEASVIERGGHFALRARDLTIDTNALFTGLETFEPNARFIVSGRFEPYDEPKPIPFPNQTDLEYPQTSSGELVLEIEGIEHRINVLGSETDVPLFLVIGDLTNGQETYGGGRFVYSEVPDENGDVTVDLNRLYNPPCVFTSWATCPLPPKQNRLPMRVEAGEKKYTGVADAATKGI